MALLLAKPASLSLKLSRKITLGYVLRLAAFSVCAFLFILYLAFAPMVNFKFFNEKVLFRPVKCTQLDPAIVGRGREVSFMNKSGSRLSGVYYPPLHQGRKTVLMHHGIGNNLNTLRGNQEFADIADVGLLTYDYSGFGKSEGSPTVRDLPDDARAAYDYLVNDLRIEPTSIVQYGGSLGSGPALVLAAEKPCAGLILFAPYTSIKAAARDAFPFLRWYPDWLVVDRDMESLTNIRNVHSPVLIIHGENDTTIPVHHGDQLYAAANSPKDYARVKGGTHFDCGHENDYKLLGFLASQ